MATVVFNAYSKAYPSITNRIRAAVYLQSSPQALVASQIYESPHPIRTYSFPGLPRNNYGFTLDEIDGSGNVLTNLAEFDAVPGQIQGTLIRKDEQIKVDTTPGLVTGATSFVFDGTGDPQKPNYIGWDIVPSELTGRGIMVEGLDYSWNKDTATFTLLQLNDKFQPEQWYNIHFEPVLDPAGNSYPTIRDFNIFHIDEDITLDSTYFGHKLIVEPGADLVTVTLPPIATIVDGRALMVEIDGTESKTVKFVPNGVEPIKFARGNIFAMTGESFTIYKYTRAGVYEWRVSEASGNFRTVGQIIGEDLLQSEGFNRQMMDGSIGNINKYARIYNEVVLNLPVGQVVAYADWATGNNKYKFSLADGSGNFRFPDRRGIIEKNTSAGQVAGTFNDWRWPEHKHESPIGTLPTPLFGVGVPTRTKGNYHKVANGQTDLTSLPVNSAGVLMTENLGTEIVPKNYLINKYVLV